MSNLKMREEFEAWAFRCAWLGLSDECMARDEINGGYYGLELHAAWLAWQASREALVIELPEPDPTGFGPGDSGCGRPSFEQEIAAQCNCVLAQCKRSIEAQGLKVKS